VVAVLGAALGAGEAAPRVDASLAAERWWADLETQVAVQQSSLPPLAPDQVAAALQLALAQARVTVACTALDPTGERLLRQRVAAAVRASLLPVPVVDLGPYTQRVTDPLPRRLLVALQDARVRQQLPALLEQLLVDTDWAVAQRRLTGGLWVFCVGLVGPEQAGPLSRALLEQLTPERVGDRAHAQALAADVVALFERHALPHPDVLATWSDDALLGLVDDVAVLGCDAFQRWGLDLPAMAAAAELRVTHPQPTQLQLDLVLPVGERRVGLVWWSRWDAAEGRWRTRAPGMDRAPARGP
jgi:hypothetical protein